MLEATAAQPQRSTSEKTAGMVTRRQVPEVQGGSNFGSAGPVVLGSRAQAVLPVVAAAARFAKRFEQELRFLTIGGGDGTRQGGGKKLPPTGWQKWLVRDPFRELVV